MRHHYMKELEKIIIIKVGSSVIFTKRNKLDEFRLNHIANQIFSLQKMGYNVVLVISGAVGCGLNNSSITNTSDSLYLLSNVLERQMAAGIGQVYLISTIFEVFRKKNLSIAQILLKKNDLSDGKVRTKFIKTMEIYFQMKIIPVFNENDVVDLNSFGGNDLLAVEIAQMLNAKKVIILSTMEGSKFGVGGRKSKEEAREILKNANIDCLILNGKTKDILCYHACLPARQVLKKDNVKYIL